MLAEFLRFWLYSLLSHPLLRITANFRKFPMAMALQLVLPFGKPVWNTKRPTTRRGRAFRAHVARVMKLVGLHVEPVVMAVPQWWKAVVKKLT